ncbi:type II secretion system protein [Haloferula sp. A504]|uniref:type II secretion system protein n=1 Tax=Haloferula sp. A504 TaxID=3373601 RepID=UPI0031C7A726|nr:type II secretion system GspH family protein [Verrucomicrobiaceae bacterium E54]
MKTNKTRLRGFTLVELLVVIVIIAALAGLSAPMILRQQKAAARTEAINNAKQMGLALLEFDQEFGSFPDDATAELVSDATGYQGTLTGSTSNDYFRQLIAYGIQSEDIFYTRTAYTRKPDNVVNNDDALEAGEVGFGYIMLDQGVGQNTSGNPGRPVLATPLLDAQTTWEFDPDPYGAKAVILNLDNSAEAPTIRGTDNKVTVGGGRTLEQTGDDTVWGTSTNPTLVAPQKAGGA